MKKKNKRLTLHRETVRQLDASGLKEVVGGTGYTHNPDQCRTSCACLDFQDTFSSDCTAGCPATSLG
jgi:hypothetical protein